MSKQFKVVLLTVLLSILGNQSDAQFEDYEYRSPITNAQVGWNYIDLRTETFDQAKKSLDDLRIYHYDTLHKIYIEQPYFLDVQLGQRIAKTVDFKLINQVQRQDEYAFTLELTNKEAVNKIDLDFVNKNFDWNIHLEGSMDNVSWSTLIDNYRIVSINNKDIKFAYSEIAIPDSKFNFYKISLKSAQKPELRNTTLSKVTRTPSNLITHTVRKSAETKTEKEKSTYYEIDLERALPISHFELSVDSQIDYYRHFTIEGARDSFQTEKGWRDNYKLLYQGTLNSYNKNVFDFDSHIVKKLRIKVYNFNSQPLIYKGFTIKGPNYRVITRLEANDNLFLVSGNDKAKSPLYDIVYFKDKLPNEMNEAQLGITEHHPKVLQKTNPLFQNKWWLWAIMILVIMLLGTFTLKMLREKQ